MQLDQLTLAALRTISLIPSENKLSPVAASAYANPMENAYYLPIEVDGNFLMPGRDQLRQLLDTVQQLAQELVSGNPQVFYQALSGMDQMRIILSALRNHLGFAKMISIHPYHGGHDLTARLASSLGYDTHFAEMDYAIWDISESKLYDLIELIGTARTIVYLDHTVTVKPIDINRLAAMIPSSWLIYYDISHLHVFFLTGKFNIRASDKVFFGGSTHKTIPGPQKALIYCKRGSAVEYAIDKQIRTVSSSIHTGSVLALYQTLLELKKYGQAYSSQILINAQKLAVTLKNSGLNIIGPGDCRTETHQVLVESSCPISEAVLASRANIITSPMRIPQVHSLGHRLGVQLCTRYGMGEAEMELIGTAFASIISRSCNIDQLGSIISELAKEYSVVRYCDE